MEFHGHISRDLLTIIPLSIKEAAMEQTEPLISAIWGDRYGPYIEYSHCVLSVAVQKDIVSVK